ncbi:hypothetical protein FSP39_004454 [Pinctada imbricata]|uniref:BTB domain-containing protein n=1 Tax=Pinctada imbricata TaxID=66713 RepID=A0AA89BU24_PINIB|nr:hypothetical protein FSP39_004454 [Pinctada imbricata]
MTQEGPSPISTALLKGLSQNIASRCLSDPSNSLSDIKIKVEDETFHCHKVILAAYSDFFLSMFTLDFKEKHQEEIALQIPVDADTFRLTLDFLYGRREQLVSYDEALQILKIADSLQIDCLKIKAENCLIEKLSLLNCVYMLKVGSTWHCERLIKQCLIRILTYFESKKLYELEDFKNLEESDVILILQDNDLSISSEDVVADAIITWFRHDVSRWQTSAAKVLRYLRFPLISSDHLTSLIEQNPFLNTDSECFMYVREALRYNLQLARRHEIDSPRVLHRNYSDLENVMYVFRRKSHHIVSFQNKTARDLKSCKEGKFYAACPYGTSIFFSGGVQTEMRLVEYDILLDKWIKRPSIPASYLDHSMVAVGNELFVLGIQRAVWKYNVHTQTWKHAGELCNTVQRTSSTVQGHSILIFGGYRADKTFHSKIQCFDTVTGECKELPHTLEWKHAKSTASNGIVYVVDTKGKIMTFSVEAGFRNIGTFSDFNFKHFDVCIFGKILYIVTPWKENGDDYDMIRRWSLTENTELRRMKTKADGGSLEHVISSVAKKPDQIYLGASCRPVTLVSS